MCHQAYTWEADESHGAVITAINTAEILIEALPSMSLKCYLLCAAFYGFEGLIKSSRDISRVRPLKKTDVSLSASSGQRRNYASRDGR
jgi:hypothetical protein